MKLRHKYALITGATGGMGMAVAKAFREEGSNLILVAPKPERLEVMRKTLLRIHAPGSIFTNAADVTHNFWMRKMLEEHSAIHIFVSCAGIYGPIGKLEDVDPMSWWKAITTNLFGSVLPCQQLLPIFKKQNWGRIILLSGGGATKPMPNFSAYASSKAAVVRFGETLAEEVKGYNISVNSVAPGALNTKMLDEVLAARPNDVGHPFYQKNLKQKREGGDSLEQAAALITQLASDPGGRVSGKLISAKWDVWQDWETFVTAASNPERFVLRRTV